MTKTISIKWGKTTVSVEVPDECSGLEFKKLVHEKTSVAPDRQKLLSKLWKGTMKDETLIKFEESAVITLMGSNDVIEKPAENTVCNIKKSLKNNYVRNCSSIFLKHATQLCIINLTHS